MIVVYADVLVLINFSMDFIALFLTAKFTSAKIKPILLIIAAVLGGFYSLAEFLIKMPLPFLSVLANLAMSFVMCIIAFGYCKLKTLLYAAVFYGICFLFGGMISGIYSLAGSKWKYMADTGYIYSDISLADIALLSAVSLVLYYIVSKVISCKNRAKQAEITVRLNGREISLKAFSDSGCIAKEPITNKPVFFIRNSYLKCFGIESAQTDYLYRHGIKFCCIPISTVTGSELMTGIFTEELISNSRMFEAIAIFVEADKLNFSDYDAIIPTIFT